jgi:glycine cleavage system protein P-like pyridoxal-binding family
LRKEEDPAAAPAANLISVPPVDAALMGVDLIILSSDSKGEVDWEALVARDEVDWEALAAEDVDDVESVGS